MKNYLVLLGIIIIGTLSFSQNSDAHSKKRTKYGKVLCLDHEGNQMTNLTACRAYTSEIGPEPDRPRKRCSVSHNHSVTVTNPSDGSTVTHTYDSEQAAQNHADHVNSNTGASASTGTTSGTGSHNGTSTHNTFGSDGVPGN